MFSVSERKLAPGIADSLHDVQHVLRGARQAIELPDYVDITLAQLVEHAVQLRQVPVAAGDGFSEDAPAARSTEGLGLQSIPLLVSPGDPGIAEQHVLGGCYKRALMQRAPSDTEFGESSFPTPVSEFASKARATIT